MHVEANLVIPAQLVTSYYAENVKFTDRLTDWQTDAGNDNTPLAWKAKG